MMQDETVAPLNYYGSGQTHTLEVTTVFHAEM